MKRILILTLMLGLFSVARAQAPFVGTATNPTRAILNATADSALYTLKNSYTAVSIQPVITRSSGTMAGKVYVWNSVNGSNYVLIDSVSLSNSASQHTILNYTGKPEKYWLLIQSGGTTVAGILNAKISAAGQ